MNTELHFVAELRAHTNSVEKVAIIDNKRIISASRDKTLLTWEVDLEPIKAGNFDRAEEVIAGHPLKRLIGHKHFVSDVAVSSDGCYALSASWDRTLHLWDLSIGEKAKVFRGHTGDVTAIAFSSDNRQIISASRDKTLILWNTVGEIKHTFVEEGHDDFVSCVTFPPNTEDPIFISCGWDKTVKIWDLATCKLRATLVGHTGYLNTVTASPDGTLCASGGRDGNVMLWELSSGGRHLYTLPASEHGEIRSLVFSPNRYWLASAASHYIVIYNLETKSAHQVIDATPDPTKQPAKDVPKPTPSRCNFTINSLTWTLDGSSLYAGCSDSIIRIYKCAEP